MLFQIQVVNQKRQLQGMNIPSFSQQRTPQFVMNYPLTHAGFPFSMVVGWKVRVTAAPLSAYVTKATSKSRWQTV